MLALAFAQYALHAVNHLLDIGEAHPERLEPANFVSIALTTALLAWMVWRTMREEHTYGWAPRYASWREGLARGLD
ncbi:MAG: hypothetical protein ACR2J6_02495 [Thermoleophilaceae bacterium]